MKIKGTKYVFDNDDELTEFCMCQYPTNYWNDKANLWYYDYDMTDQYNQAIADGIVFIVLDPNSRAVKNGHINRGLITKCVKCLGPEYYDENDDED
jgi:hypothetical protein